MDFHELESLILIDTPMDSLPHAGFFMFFLPLEIPTCTITWSANVIFYGEIWTAWLILIQLHEAGGTICFSCSLAAAENTCPVLTARISAYPQQAAEQMSQGRNPGFLTALHILSEGLARWRQEQCRLLGLCRNLKTPPTRQTVGLYIKAFTVHTCQTVWTRSQCHRVYCRLLHAVSHGSEMQSFR